jgi:hypothetical protein
MFQMASGALPHSLHVHGTSATNGGQTFAGINTGTINYADSNILSVNEDRLVPVFVKGGRCRHNNSCM